MLFFDNIFDNEKIAFNTFVLETIYKSDIIVKVIYMLYTISLFYNF